MKHYLDRLQNKILVTSLPTSYHDSNISLAKLVFGEIQSSYSCVWLSEWSFSLSIKLVTLSYHLAKQNKFYQFLINI